MPSLTLNDEQAQAFLAAKGSAFSSFEARPDCPEDFDQQTAYVEAKDSVSFCLGGNGSGKTAASAKKCADFLLSTRPPRKDTPFWIIAQSYNQVCSVCWNEKLWEAGFLPKWEVDVDRIVWLKPTLNWPLMVPLKPWDDGNNWLLEFKSYEQGRQAMQARSIGGFWFSEQVAWPIFLEVLRGCRDYMYPGGQFLEFTPIEPDLCVAVEHIMDNPPHGWGFYRLNTDRNRANLAPDWYDSFFGSVPDEMMATRKTGALATFEGVIYQTFNPAFHVIHDDNPVWRSGMTHHTATDWGASAEHPFVTVWGCYDGMGEWTVYDEYWSTSQDAITQDHAAEVLARSIAWGWPEPDFFRDPHPRQAYFVQQVKKRVRELRPAGIKPVEGSTYGENYADPSRPGEINAFNQWGITTSPASNDVYKGIDIVRSRLKINPMTGKSRLYFHERCKHAIEEHRKYRWLRKKPNSLWTTAAARPVPLKKDDDTADAVRYLIASVERGRGQAPTSTDSRGDPSRADLQLERAGNGHLLRPMQAATAGFFRK
jgi:phage terminase large subunit-like protein